VLKIPKVGNPECEGNDNCISIEVYEVLVSTTMILVMVTTLLFGNFMKATGNLLVPPTAEDAEEYNKVERA
jgi:hypothetical protein